LPGLIAPTSRQRTDEPAANRTGSCQLYTSWRVVNAEASDRFHSTIGTATRNLKPAMSIFTSCNHCPKSAAWCFTAATIRLASSTLRRQRASTAVPAKIKFTMRRALEQRHERAYLKTPKANVEARVMHHMLALKRKTPLPADAIVQRQADGRSPHQQPGGKWPTRLQPAGKPLTSVRPEGWPPER
jgi:hypothetical protein